MELLIIAVIAFFVIRFIVNKVQESNPKPVKVFSKGDPSTLPDTLTELRQMRDKTRNEEIEYQCRRKICDVGIQLYREGKIVNDPNSEYDATKLIGEMYNLIDDCNTYTRFPADRELEFRCLDAGVEMSEKLDVPTPYDGEVFKFLDYAWRYLPDLCAEGKVCPRDPAKARKYFRMRIVYEIKTKDTSTTAVEGLMEVPNAGEDGKQEILKFIAMKYGIGAAQVLNGEAVRNFQAQTLQQAAELLFQMNWDKIGGNDISAMLDEYRRCADAGNAYAQYKLGEFYLDGRYVPKNAEQGLALLEKAASQDLYLAVDKLSNHYHWLAYPYAGDYGGVSKQQIKEWQAQYNKWCKKSDSVLGMVEKKYANSFTEYLNNSENLPTRGAGKVAVTTEHTAEAQDEEKYHGSMFDDRETPFTIMDLPDVITGPYNVTYRKTSVGTYSADYYSDHGDTATIHVGDIGMSGTSAKNSYGYFYW